MNADMGELWPVGDSAMGAMLRAHDWSRTPLGPIGTWPPSLRIMTASVLANGFPMLLAWGAALTCIYNDAYRPLLGGKPEALGRPLLEVWAELVDLITPLVDKARAGETSYFEAAPVTLARNGYPEDAYFDYCFSPVRDEIGGIVGVLITAVDTTRRSQVEAALLETRNQFRALLEASSEVMYRMSPDWSEMRQLSGGGFLLDTPRPNRDWLDAYIHPNDQQAVLAAIQEAIRTKGTFDLEHRVRRAGGGLGWTHSRALPILGADGEIVEWFGAASDITQRKLAEERLRHAKEEAERANMSKSRFLAAASHDLRQPMQSLLLFLDLLEPHVAPQGRDALNHLGRGLDVLRDLLNSLLDVSRLDAGVVAPVLEDFAIQEFIGEIGAAYAPVALAKGVTFQVEACPGVVHSDRTMLGRMVRNLVENALRYTDAGQVTISCHEAGRRLRIEVHDTGIGIPAEHLSWIWEEFHQVGNPERDRNRGLGLGLAIVQRLSILLDHPVHVRSTLGVGSQFSIEVPLGDAGRIDTRSGT